MFSLINDNSKKIKNKSNEKLKGNFSFEIEENSFDLLVLII